MCLSDEGMLVGQGEAFRRWQLQVQLLLLLLRQFSGSDLGSNGRISCSKIRLVLEVGTNLVKGLGGWLPSMSPEGIWNLWRSSALSEQDIEDARCKKEEEREDLPGTFVGGSEQGQ